MKIENLKELQQLIQLCRKTGVESIKVDNIELHLGVQPTIRKRQTVARPSTSQYAPGGITEDVRITTDGLTDEQLLFYSAQDHMTSEQQ